MVDIKPSGMKDLYSPYRAHRKDIADYEARPWTFKFYCPSCGSSDFILAGKHWSHKIYQQMYRCRKCRKGTLAHSFFWSNRYERISRAEQLTQLLQSPKDVEIEVLIEREHGATYEVRFSGISFNVDVVVNSVSETALTGFDTDAAYRSFSPPGEDPLETV